jgi:hypothetical protein
MRNSTKIPVTAKRLLIIAFFALLLPFQQLSAQAKKPGGNKPSVSKPAANKPSVNKPDVNKSNVNKPNVNKSSVKKPDVNRPDANKSTSNRPSVNKSDAKSIGGKDGRADNPGNRTNNVNIDNSKKNVNINVDKSKDIHVNNSRNTSVRRNTRAYGRPPYVYGGRRYNCYHPYYYHPYRPYVWGPRWHPWGFFVATLATTAIIVSIVDNDMDLPSHYDMASNYFSGFGQSTIDKHLLRSGPALISGSENHGYAMRWARPEKLAIDGEYYYDEGVYYLKGDGGYTVVSAPIGAKIKTLPAGYETVSVDDAGTKNYYYGGVFYEKRSDGYVVVAPLAGTIVENVSEGGEEVKMGDITYIKMGETYFQPIKQDGKDMYEVADVEDDK